MDGVRTPMDYLPALELGNKLWRKEIIKQGTIHYDGGRFEATPEYLDSVVAAFKERAIGSVPFTFVDDYGRHVESPNARKGNVVGLERTPTGLDAIVALDDDADALVQKDKKFGVSVLIKHNRTTGNGKQYPAVLAHVAGTYDPVLNDLGDWQEFDQIAASNDVTDVLDLLALTSSAPRDEPTRKALMADTLAPEELAVLRSLLARLTPDEPADPATPVVEPATDLPADQPFTDGDPEPTDTPEGDAAEFTDEEIAAMVASLDDIPADEPAMVAAGHESSPADLELSHQLEAEQQARRDSELRLAQVEAKLAAQEYEAERLQLAQRHGIPPRITDIVRPLLEGTGGKLALSNGSEVDPAALIRKFVVELASTPRLDLSHPVGSGQGVDIDDDEEAAATERAALAKLAVQSMS